MSCASSWSQNHVSPPPIYKASPAVYNSNDNSIFFLPRPLPRNEFNMLQDLNSQNPMIKNECITLHRSFSVSRNLPRSQPRMIQGSHPLANQVFVNGPNIAKNPNLLLQKLSCNNVNMVKRFHPSTNQLPVNRSNMTQQPYLQYHHLHSERAQMIQDFRPVTDPLSANQSSVPQLSYPLIHQQPSNESSVPQLSYPLIHQLPSNGIGLNQNSKMLIQQQPSRSASSVSHDEHSPTHVLCKNELGRNQIKYPSSHQQSERESVMRQGLHSTFGRHSRDGLGMAHHRCITGQPTEGNESLYPLPSNVLEMGFNINQERLVSNTVLNQNLYLQHIEEVVICVVGPPRCGKADLIRTFARNDDIRISTDKPLSWVLQQGMVSFRTTLKIDIWYGEDLTSAAPDLKSLCESSKSVIALVYRIGQKSTLLTVLQWIRFLKRYIGSNVAIILIGNATDVDSCASSEFSERTPNFLRFSEGVGAKQNYDLAASYECSTKSVEDVEEIFLTAAFTAIHRKT